MTLSLLVATACTGSSPKTPLGPLADVGFRPNNNGFSFANHGDTLPDGTTSTNLTATDLRTMFGDSVCASDILGRCTLNPQAQAWLNSTNEAMAGGHAVTPGQVFNQGRGQFEGLIYDNNYPTTPPGPSPSTPKRTPGWWYRWPLPSGPGRQGWRQMSVNLFRGGFGVVRSGS